MKKFAKIVLWIFALAIALAVVAIVKTAVANAAEAATAPRAAVAPAPVPAPRPAAAVTPTAPVPPPPAAVQQALVPAPVPVAATEPVLAGGNIANPELRVARFDLELPTLAIRGTGKEAKFGLGFGATLRLMNGQHHGAAVMGGVEALWPNFRKETGQQWAYTVGVGYTFRTRFDMFQLVVAPSYTSRLNNAGQAMDIGGGLAVRVAWRIYHGDNMNLSWQIGALAGPIWVYNSPFTAYDENGKRLTEDEWRLTGVWRAITGLECGF